MQIRYDQYFSLTLFAPVQGTSAPQQSTAVIDLPDAGLVTTLLPPACYSVAACQLLSGCLRDCLPACCSYAACLLLCDCLPACCLYAACLLLCDCLPACCPYLRVCCSIPPVHSLPVFCSMTACLHAAPLLSVCCSVTACLLLNSACPLFACSFAP
jgi:hypothetical protein